jgi:hypothetical protein
MDVIVGYAKRLREIEVKKLKLICIYGLAATAVILIVQFFYSNPVGEIGKAVTSMVAGIWLWGEFSKQFFPLDKEQKRIQKRITSLLPEEYVKEFLTEELKW